MRCYVRLIGNQVDIWPRPTDIQMALRSVVGGIESCCKGVLAWGSEGRKREISASMLEQHIPDIQMIPPGTSGTLSQTCKS